MDLIDFLIIGTICFVCIAFMAGETTERALDTFGAGFLPYRKEGWPRGVQEGEAVAWDWSKLPDRDVPAFEREPEPDSPAEIFEIDGDAEPGGLGLSDVAGGSVGAGGSFRGSSGQ